MRDTTDSDHDIDLRLDRDLEREGGYRTLRDRIPLHVRGAVRVALESGVLNPPTHGGRR